MVNEVVEIIGLYNLGYVKQANSFLYKILNKAKDPEKHSETINKLYFHALELIQQKNYKLCIQLLFVLEEITQKTKDKNKLCDIKNNLSYCYRMSSCFSESLSKCLEALEIVTQTNELRGKLPALHLNACAIYKEDFKDLPNAKTHAKLAYFFAKETYKPIDSGKRTLAVTLFNYGLLHDELNEFSTAQELYRQVLVFCNEE